MKMADIDLGKDLGKVEVTSKKFTANLKVNSARLFSMYPTLVEDLSKDAITMIRDAVDKKKEIQPKKSEAEIIEFFQNVKSFSGKLGMGVEEKGEIKKSENLKKQQMDEGKVDYGDRTRTVDRDTGKEEGSIKFGTSGREGKLIPIKIDENFTASLGHDGKLIEGKKVETKGKFSIVNVSNKDRLWDIDLKLAESAGTDLEEEFISVAELAPGKTEEVGYSLTKKELKPLVEIKEFISTLNDPKSESYSLVLNADNNIYTAITIKNLSDAKLTAVEVKKLIPAEFSKADIVHSSIGKTNIDNTDNGKVAIWTIEELGANAEQKIEIRTQVNIKDKNTKVHSGKILVKYTSPTSLSGLKIEKFDAYTNNNFYISSDEQDEEPDKYDCQFTFENKSEFMLRLVNADVYDPKDDKKKYVDIDPEEVPPLPGGAKWVSNSWQYKAEAGVDPHFKTKVEFFVISDHQINTTSTLDIADLELAVASIEGWIKYDVTRLASFKETEFHATMHVENTGGANLNEVILTEKIQTGFVPPAADQVVITLNDEEIELDTDAIKIEPSNQDAKSVHTVTVSLKDLRETELEAFGPGDVVEVKYPIIASRPDKEIKYVSNVLYLANTYPAGKALEVRAQSVEIEVTHIRKKYYAGKEITALSTAGQYEITLYVVNTGQFELVNYEIIDRIPENFEYSKMTEDPDVKKEAGQDVLKWVIEKIAPGDRYEVKYNLSGEGKPSDAQVAN
jgi:hypothetical protein